MSAAAQRYRQPAARITPERRGMLTKCHLARKQLGLDEAAYRDVVERITGARSAGVADDAALHRLVAEFTRLGFVASRPQHAKRRPPRDYQRLIGTVWADLAPYLAEPSEAALRTFVQRQTRTPAHPDGVAAPAFLDGKQAGRVIQGLKAWLARERAKAGAA